MALLEVKNLSLSLRIGEEILPVARDVSFSLQRGEAFGLVGESGCGKSLASLAIMGLLEDTPVRVSGGEILFDGIDLLNLPRGERRALMGSEMAMIFQEPMPSLNPVYRVGDQIVEAIRRHQKLSRARARERALELLSLARLADPKTCFSRFPHQLSGGMRQRAMIAMALSCAPKLLIADEPTTALDVTVQARILDLILHLRTRENMAVILISHDLGVIARVCDKVAVMYRGEIVESAPIGHLFSSMRHPYTRGLLAAIPDSSREVNRLSAIEGRVPALDESVSGCAFHPRCPNADAICSREPPPRTDLPRGHAFNCRFPVEAGAEGS